MSKDSERRIVRSWATSTLQSDIGSDFYASLAVEESPNIRGAHRDGYSEDKCRYVLVKHCSDIPRNFDYSDGSHLVYEVLRLYLGDENLDLSMGVLHEFIELDTEYTWEEGSAFRRWRHDHCLRAKDLGNAHVPRLGNIVVAPVIPTSRLRAWRYQSDGSKCQQSQQPIATDIRDTLKLPSFGVRTEWQIDHSTFISIPGKGTSVLHCPSAQEVNTLYFRGDCGQKGRLVKERTVTPGICAPKLPTEMSFNAFDGLNVLESGLLPTEQPNLAPLGSVSKALSRGMLSLMGSWHQRSSSLDTPLMPRVDCGCDSCTHSSFSAAVYENLPTVQGLPDPGTSEGKAYYGNIGNVPLPQWCNPINGSFIRKHNLIPGDMHLPDSIKFNRLRHADDLAIDRSVEKSWQAAYTNEPICFDGPFTAELFKDSGVDYRWSLGGFESPRDLGCLEDGNNPCIKWKGFSQSLRK